MTAILIQDLQVSRALLAAWLHLWACVLTTTLVVGLLSYFGNATGQSIALHTSQAAGGKHRTTHLSSVSVLGSLVALNSS